METFNIHSRTKHMMMTMMIIVAYNTTIVLIRLKDTIEYKHTVIACQSNASIYQYAAMTKSVHNCLWYLPPSASRHCYYIVTYLQQLNSEMCLYCCLCVFFGVLFYICIFCDFCIYPVCIYDTQRAMPVSYTHLTLPTILRV